MEFEHEVESSFEKLEKIITDSAKSEANRLLKQHKGNYAIFTDSPVSNFNTDKVVDHLNKLFGDLFVFSNEGSIFKYLEEYGIRDQLIPLLNKSRKDKLGHPTFDQLAFEDSRDNVRYTGINLYPYFKLEPKFKDKFIYSGRCMVSPDSDGRIHSRSFLGSILSTSGMYFGPGWGEFNDPKITEFGKVLAAIQFICIFLVPCHYKDEDHSSGVVIPAPGYGNIGVLDLAEKILPPKAPYSNLERFNEVINQRCIFYDAHTPEIINEYNLSGRMCLFHKTFINSVQSSTGKRLMEQLRKSR